MREQTGEYKKEYAVHIPAGRSVLEGRLGIPGETRGTVVFPNAGGSIRCNFQNHFIAMELRKRNLATLLVNLLTIEEEVIDLSARNLRFNIRLLAGRLSRVTGWLKENALAEHKDVCYFGFNTSAAAALVAAVRQESMVNSIVVRAGRVDLADDVLPLLQAPVLFLVGENDFSLIDFSREAERKIYVEHRLEILSGLDRNFEKPSALKDAARRSAQWFLRNLSVEEYLRQAAQTEVQEPMMIKEPVNV